MQRKLLTLLLPACVVMGAHAQAPNLLNYQAAARDGGGVVLMNTPLTVRFTIRVGSATGTNVYRETHGVTTNAFGLFDAQVGGGTVVSGSFASIGWGSNSHWLQVEVNPGGGYVDLGAQQLVSVPYAKYAETSGGGSSGWGLTGNSGTDPNTDFIGTSDAQPLVFKVNGAEAGRIGLIGSGNTSLGASTLAANTTGTSNTAMGSGAMQNNTSGDHNTAVGTGALYVNTSSNNTALGSLALAGNTTGTENTAVGKDALFGNTNGEENTAIGVSSLENNMDGTKNTAVGAKALRFNTSIRNTATGASALQYNVTGQQNTAVGASAMAGNTTGSNNTSVGDASLYFNNLGSNNTACGKSALLYNNGDYNVGVGSAALSDNLSGHDNVAIGVEAMSGNNTGNYNTALGNYALGTLTNGIDNISIGWGSGTTGSFSNTINIGNYGYLNAFGNQAFIGNLSTIWNGGNVTWSTYSDERVKTDVRDDVHGLDFITRLRPVTYHRDIDRQAELTGNKSTRDYPEKYAIERIKFSGFLAQQVEQAAQEVGYDFSGVTPPPNENQLYTVSYEQFVVPLVKAVQEQQVLIVELQHELARLREVVEATDPAKR
ncbi:MAG TPA: tail fiber domain-containing protein [Flavobacteriales bacterium]|nr:tail fiber domain-containing protein [Flavobacteriales bacterium]HMR26132.1 tail fiber domain-containing protein [Flavobacteriales bacterium]